MRRLLAFSLCFAAPALPARALELLPLLGTELRYEQQAADRLMGTNDAIQFRAPGA